MSSDFAKRYSDWEDWSEGFASRFVEWLKEDGWSDQEILNLLEKDEKFFERAIEDFADALAYPAERLSITIDYRQSLIEGLISDGNYCAVDDKINSARFSTERHGVWEINLYLLSREYLFDELIDPTTEDVRIAMEKRGFVPSGEYFGIQPLLIFGRDYRENIRKFDLEILPTLVDIGLSCEKGQDKGLAYVRLSQWHDFTKDCQRLCLRSTLHGVDYFTAVRANAVNN